jgi:phage tail sheath protein FI
MPEFLSPGVFIEEVPSQIQTILSVSTSTMGAVGFTQRGPADAAVLVTSLDQYNRLFGPFVADSLLGLSMVAFFANGGRRAYVVRVVPADAALADCRIQGSYRDQLLFKSDGATLSWTATGATTALKAADGDAPLVPNIPGGVAPGVVLKYRTAGVGVTLLGTENRASTDALVGDGATAVFEGQLARNYMLNVAGVDANANVQYIAKATGDQSAITVQHAIGVALAVAVVGTAILVTQVALGDTAAAVAAAVNAHPAASLLVDAIPTGDGSTLCLAVVAAPLAAQTLPTFDAELDSVVPGTITFSWYSGAALLTLAVVLKSSSIVSATTAGNSKVTVDTRTGRFSFHFATVAAGDAADEFPDAAFPIMASYTPASATVTVADDGAGSWPAPLQAGSAIDYDDGSYTLTWLIGGLPHDQARVLVSYQNNAWNLAPVSKGSWSNDIKLQVYGNPDYYNVATASYSRYNVVVRLYNTATLTYDVVEQFEEVSFTDNTSVQYFPDVVNELSDYIQVTEPGSDYSLPDLAGYPKLMVLAGGDESVGGQAIATSVSGTPISARSVTISWTDNTGTARTVTDDGAGNLIGDVDGAGTNTISYTTGAIDVTLGYPIDAGTVVQMTWYTAPDEEDHLEVFGGSEYVNGTLTATGKQYTYGGVAYYQAGTDGTFDSTNYGRSQFTSPTLVAGNQGMFALSKVEEILQVIIPDFAGDPTVIGDQLDYAATRAALPHGGDRFIILSTPVGKSPQEAVDWFRYDLLRFSDYAALYWPWIKVADPLANNRPKLIPPLGHIAGIYARTDATRNVGKAPGGTIDGQLNFLLGLEYAATQGERDLLYPNKINPLATGTNIGNAVWGVRTISANAAWRYINVRRLFMFLEKSVYNSTFWAVFEPNGGLLWSKISTSLGSFLLNLFNQGYFAGATPSEAFFVICDDSNNDQSSIDAGSVVCDIGVAPSKPAEFVRFRFAQKTL